MALDRYRVKYRAYLSILFIIILRNILIHIEPTIVNLRFLRGVTAAELLLVFLFEPLAFFQDLGWIRESFMGSLLRSA